MPRTAWSVPYGADETAFVVIDRLGRREGVEREIEVERTDIETIISELVAGQFNDPARVIAYNTLEHWSQDISEDIALEIQSRCDIEGTAVPEHIHDFVANFAAPARQSARAALQRKALKDSLSWLLGSVAR
jgi:hypothetical protein